MNTIRLTPQLMRERASQYRAYSEQVSQLKGNLQTVLGQISTEWQGTASNKFVNQFSENMKAIDNVILILDNVTNYLQASANAYEEVDNNISNQLNI